MGSPESLSWGQAAMSQDRNFDDLMARLRAGDEAAATEVFQRYGQRLIALARSRLDRHLGTKVDPEDVLQSVFQSFFARHVNGQFELEDWNSLWGLLTVITIRKCHRQYERFQTERRDVQREFLTPFSPSKWGSNCEAIARDPTPSEAAILAETVENLMRGLEGRERHMLTLRLQGYKIPEISEQVGRTERTVRRVLDRVKRQLERLRAGDEAG
jgi:RNA polymerase sigma-70 factor (ECF subfamily)